MLAIVARDAPAPSFAPGTRFEYSNLGYDAAALLIERVSGTPYAQFVRERFLAPLGMRSTFARPARLSDWTGVRTLGYRWHDGAWQVFDVFDREGFLGASNLYLSASDLSRWVAAHAAGSPPLPAAAFAAGQRRGEIAGRRTPLTELSWYCDDAVERCYYTGSLNAFHAFAWSDRARNESVAFVSNSTLPPWRVVSLQRALVDALAGRPADVNPAATFARSDRVTRRSLAGSWLAPGVDPVSLVPTSTGLRMRFGAGLEYDVFQVSREVFYVPGPDVWFAFSGSPPAVSMHLRGMFVDAVAQRAGQGAPRHVVVPAIADRR
jgi:CubicO group peptidase (beta-lactamase class C family)